MGRSDITYYEDEIFCDYKELVTKFLQDEYPWNSVNKIDKMPYFDPDCEHLRSCSYYQELTQFLRQREEDMKKNLKGEFEYIAPLNCKNDDGQYETEHGVKGKITVRCSGNTCEQDMYLKSDQFGFSVANFDTHPYGILYEIAKQQNNEIKKDTYDFIADCINDTRTIGGGFLWPLDIWNYYNKNRGGSRKTGKYIDDRVDLTLLEMKYLFEWILCEDEHKKEKIWAHYSNKNIIIFKDAIKNDKKGMEWLRHFRSFKNYIKFFCFDDFMKDDMPLDIVTSKLELSEDGMKVKGKKNPLKESTEYMPRKEHSIYRLFNPKNENNLEEMKKILNNVRILTIARSNRMQTFVDRYRKRNKDQSSIF